MNQNESEKVKKRRREIMRKKVADLDKIPDRPYRCPLLLGEDYGPRTCSVTQQVMNNSKEWWLCDSYLIKYMSCLHFSQWYWKHQMSRRIRVKAVEAHD